LWSSVVHGRPLPLAVEKMMGRPDKNGLNEERLGGPAPDLNAAVAAGYGWAADISEDDALARLFALNQAADRNSE